MSARAAVPEHQLASQLMAAHNEVVITQQLDQQRML